MKSKKYVAVIGGINIDIGGKPFHPMVVKDSNPGTVTSALGGVGRNIAHNLRLMGTDVRFLTVIGEDIYTPRIERSCLELGIDIRDALRISGGKNPVYLFLNDADGDMLMALSDMALCDRITPDYLSAHRAVLAGAAVTVADTNLPADSLEWLASSCPSELFADPVSTAKAGKLRTILGKIHTLKSNRLEAELLSGVEIRGKESLAAAAEALLRTGLQRVFITLGSNGALAADKEELLFAPCCPAEVRNTTGAGDAFMASLLCSRLEQQSLADTLRTASATAALATESEETVNPLLCPDRIRERAKHCFVTQLFA